MSARAYPSLLDAWASAAPMAPALIYRDKPVSAGELARRSRVLAASLASLGLKAGDRAAIWMPNVPAWLIALTACARLDVTVVSVNTRYRRTEVEDLLARTRPKALFLWPAFRGIDFMGILAEVAQDALASLAHIITYAEDDGGASLPAACAGTTRLDYAALEGGDKEWSGTGTCAADAVYFTTSGTTKAPKLVRQGQASLADHAGDVARRFEWSAPGTVLLQALPYCGTFGLSQANGALAAHAPSVVDPVFDPARALDLIKRYKATHLFSTDDMVAKVMAEARGAADFASIRFWGHAKFNPALETLPKDAQRLGIALIGAYGSSELQALFAGGDAKAPLPGRARPGGGLVSPKANARVRRADGSLAPVGETGDLECRGPSLFSGYLDDAEASRAAMTDDGYFRTGDLAAMRPDGGFTFAARAGDALRLSGFLVSPQEIEAFVERLPGIAGCQVVGADTAAGTVPVAFVIVTAGAALDESALRAACARGLARYKVPRRFVTLDAFPVTTGPNGTKIQRAKLRDMAAGLSVGERG
jgi:fatty-acyl-CoA synthase